MPSDDLPEPVYDAAQRAADALFHTDSMRSTLDALARLSETAHADLSRTSATVAAVADALAFTQPAWQEQMQRITATMGQRITEHLSVLERIQWGSPDLERVMASLGSMQTTISEDQWAAAARVLEDSYGTVGGDPDGEVPDELVDGLGEPARDFASAQAGIIPATLQRQLFVYFIGILVLAALMQASFTSEKADEVIDKTIALAPVAGFTMLAAGTAWDRYVRRPEDDEDSEDDGSEHDG